MAITDQRLIPTSFFFPLQEAIGNRKDRPRKEESANIVGESKHPWHVFHRVIDAQLTQLNFFNPSLFFPPPIVIEPTSSFGFFSIMQKSSKRNVSFQNDFWNFFPPPSRFYWTRIEKGIKSIIRIRDVFFKLIRSDRAERRVNARVSIPYRLSKVADCQQRATSRYYRVKRNALLARRVNGSWKSLDRFSLLSIVPWFDHASPVSFPHLVSSFTFLRYHAYKFRIYIN